MNKIEKVVIIGSLVGLVALFIIASLTEPVVISPANISSYEGRDVMIRGTVTDLYMTKYGGGILEVTAGKSRAKVFIEDFSKQVNYGDTIKVTGKVRKYKGDYEVVTLNDRSIQVVSHENKSSMFLQSLADDPMSYEGKNIRVMGYVDRVYEKSFYLRDGDYSLKVISDVKPNESEKIIADGLLVYDEDDMRYVLRLNRFECI